MKRALVTGGASPLGAAMCRELAAQGLHVIIPWDHRETQWRRAHYRKFRRELMPMKRAGTPAEVAALVGFLVSDRAGYISARTISIEGGMAAGLRQRGNRAGPSVIGPPISIVAAAAEQDQKGSRSKR